MVRIMVRFIEKLEQDIPGEGVKEQLRILCNVYALYLVHKHLGDFLSTGSITARQGALANEQLGKLYAQVWCPPSMSMSKVDEKLRNETNANAGAAERGGAGGRVQLHRPLPGVGAGALRRQCLPGAVRGGVEGPPQRHGCAGRLPGAPPPSAQAAAQALQAMIIHPSSSLSCSINHIILHTI